MTSQPMPFALAFGLALLMTPLAGRLGGVAVPGVLHLAGAQDLHLPANALNCFITPRRRSIHR